MKSRLIAIVLILAFFILIPLESALALSYSVSKLSDFISYDTSLYDKLLGESLNDDGDIAGIYEPIYPPGYPFTKYSYQPFFWSVADGFQPINNNPQDGAYQQVALNNNDQVVYNLNAGAFLWDNSLGTSQPLGSINSKASFATGINDNAQVAARLQTGNSDAFLWDATNGFTPLQTVPSSSSNRTGGINSAGTVAGSTDITQPSFITQAAYWDSSGAHVIPTSSTSSGVAVNDQEKIVGTMYAQIDPSTTAQRAFLWNGSAIADLGALGSDPSNDKSFAIDINNQDQVIGFGSSPTLSGQYAFIWDQSSGMQNLSDLIDSNPGWTVSYAFDINNKSQILAEGILEGRRYSILLSPVVTPEPASMALFGLGAAALGLAKRRKKSPIRKT